MAKTKALISFAVTAKLICVFVFAYADCWFSNEAAHFSSHYVGYIAVDFQKTDKYNKHDSVGIPFNGYAAFSIICSVKCK